MLNYKKPAFWIVCVAVVLTIVASVCLILNPRTNGAPDLTNEELTITNQTGQKSINEIKYSAIPNFAQIYSNTVEIEINIDANGIYRGLNAIDIKDGKIISDILTMIGESQVITDESKINNMSGMAA